MHETCATGTTNQTINLSVLQNQKKTCWQVENK